MAVLDGFESFMKLRHSIAPRDCACAILQTQLIYSPPPTNTHTHTSDGCIVPLGTSIDTGVSNPHGYTLNYNGKHLDIYKYSYM